MNDQTAVAARSEGAALAEPLVISAIAGRGDVERVETVIELPPLFQYVIPGRKKVGNDWQDDNKVGITADGYDYLNRALGANFWLPDFVPNKKGEMVRNPIHEPGYIYVRMGAVWYNEVGQLTSYIEDLEVDFAFTYQQARLESPGAEVAMNNGAPVFDENGYPVILINDATFGHGQSARVTTAAEQEKKALKTLMQLQTMGMRYAQTVLRVRLLKVALGVKSLPIQQPRAMKLRVVGFRDRMDPVERQRKADKGVAALYGRTPDAKPLTHAEMSNIENAEVDTDIDPVATSAGLVQPVGGEFDLPPEESNG